jgi:hypothetical protein
MVPQARITDARFFLNGAAGNIADVLLLISQQ